MEPFPNIRAKWADSKKVATPDNSLVFSSQDWKAETIHPTPF